jgi:hypothetical protein
MDFNHLVHSLVVLLRKDYLPPKSTIGKQMQI